jgi:hypothetical protein
VAKPVRPCKFLCKAHPESQPFAAFFNWHINCIMLGDMGASRTLGPKAQAVDNRGIRIIAKSVYRELRNSGHSRSDIVAFTNAVLELVTTELRDAQEAAE